MNVSCYTNVKNLDKFIVKQNVKLCETQAENEWQIPLLEELLDIIDQCLIYWMNLKIMKSPT